MWVPTTKNKGRQKHQTSRNLNNSFNKTYDNVYPYIRDYKEKIRKLKDESFQLQTIKNNKNLLIIIVVIQN